MNIYARYFDSETLVHSLDELFQFLDSIEEIGVTPGMVTELTDYVNSTSMYPKRYKVRPRVYFILIKTTAETMEEFHANRKQDDDATAQEDPNADEGAKALDELHQYVGKNNDESSRYLKLDAHCEGWYRAEIFFKRVCVDTYTQKCRYADTSFSALVRAEGPRDCYARVVDHLQKRSDIDPRSQFPSIKGQNFSCEYFGKEFPLDLVEEV